MGEGLRGFQFPLVGKPIALGSGSGDSRAPLLNRNKSAAPTLNQSTESPERSGDVGTMPPRPGMMRQASVAVMEGRSQAQAQAQALAQVHEDPLSPTRALPLPRPNFAQGPGVAMARSRSGSRADSDAGTAMSLRDLLKVRRFGA